MKAVLPYKVPKVRTYSTDYRDCYDLCEQNGWKHGTLLAPTTESQDGVWILWEITERWIILRGSHPRNYRTLDMTLDWRELDDTPEPVTWPFKIAWPEIKPYPGPYSAPKLIAAGSFGILVYWAYSSTGRHYGGEIHKDGVCLFSGKFIDYPTAQTVLGTAVNALLKKGDAK